MNYEKMIKNIDYWVDYYSNPIYSMLRPALMIDWLLANKSVKDDSTIDNMKFYIDPDGKWKTCVDLAKQDVNTYKKRLFDFSYSGPDWKTFFEQVFGIGATKADAINALNGQSLRRLIIDQIMMSEKDLSPEELVTCFIYALDYYQPSKNHRDDFLWYVTADARLGRCSFIGENKWADFHLDNLSIEIESDTYPKAVRVIDNQGCAKVRHRPLLKEIGESWNEHKVNKIASFLDGYNKDCHLIIDRDFATAYAPEYKDSNVLEGDLVTGDSCMSERPDEAQAFYGSIDGCYVARFENNEGEQVARCLMYEYNGIRHFIRLYALREYQYKAYELLRAEMRENDLFGRKVRIDGLKLKCDFDDTTPCMYLDGNFYGFNIDDGEIFMVDTEKYDYFTKCTTTEEDGLFSHFDIAVCENCGKICDPYVIDGCYYCSEDCAHEAGFVKCAHCGDWINIKLKSCFIAPNGDAYCCDYCLHCDGLRACTYCGKVYKPDSNEIIDIDSQNRFCSESCAKEYGLVRDDITGGWTSDYIQTRKGTYVDCNELIKNKEKFNIVITNKKGA